MVSRTYTLQHNLTGGVSNLTVDLLGRTQTITYQNHKSLVYTPVTMDAILHNELRISGKGAAGYNGGPNGDIYIEFSVKEHPLFERKESDVYIDVPITITEAVLGCKKEIPTLNGTVVIDIEAGSQSGDNLRLKGKGIKDPNRKRYGDLYVVLDVVIPTKLDRKQKQLFKELSETDLKKIHGIYSN